MVERMSSLRRGTSAMALAAAAFLALPGQPAVAQDLTLEFVVWNYSLDTIEDNVRAFEEANEVRVSASRSRRGSSVGLDASWRCGGPRLYGIFTPSGDGRAVEQAPHADRRRAR